MASLSQLFVRFLESESTPGRPPRSPSSPPTTPSGYIDPRTDPDRPSLATAALSRTTVTPSTQQKPTSHSLPTLPTMTGQEKAPTLKGGTPELNFSPIPKLETYSRTKPKEPAPSSHSHHPWGETSHPLQTSSLGSVTDGHHARGYPVLTAASQNRNPSSPFILEQDAAVPSQDRATSHSFQSSLLRSVLSE